MLYNLYKYIKVNKVRNFIIRLIVKREKGYAYSKTIRKIFSEFYGINIGYGTYGGCFNTTNVPTGVTFGNYCSIAPNVKIYRANHPSNEFTLHPILYNPVMGYVKKDMLERPTLKIGNDVWIGEGAIILPNVMKIGNGSIIGAGSVVTKDVNPYSIVAGNPAKVIKNRFSDSIISKVEDSKWWELEFNDLVCRIKEFQNITNESN